MWVPYSNHSVHHPQFFADATVVKVFKLHYPNWMWEPPLRCRCVWAWNFGSATFDLGAMTLNLEILWTLCVQGIDANVASWCLLTTHEG